MVGDGGVDPMAAPVIRRVAAAFAALPCRAERTTKGSMMTETAPGAARRLRGRLASGVTVWTAGHGREACGLTVASVLVTEGEPPHVLGTVGDLSDLLDTVRAHGRFVVHVLDEADRHLAARFAGAVPTPGGALHGLTVADSAFGPVLTDVGTRACCRLVDEREVGYPVLLDGVIDELVLGDLTAPLTYFRGQFRRLTEPPRTWQAPGPDAALHLD